MIVCAGFAFVGCDEDTTETPQTPPAETPAEPPAETPAEIATIEINKTYRLSLILEGETEEDKVYLKFLDDGTCFITMGGSPMDGYGSYIYQEGTYFILHNFMGGMGDVPMYLNFIINETENGIVGQGSMSAVGITNEFKDFKLTFENDTEVVDGVYTQVYNRNGAIQTGASLFICGNEAFEINPGRDSYGVIDEVARYEIHQILGDLIVLKSSLDNYYYINTKAKVDGDELSYCKTEKGYYLYQETDTSVLGLKASKTVSAKFYNYINDNSMWETEVVEKDSILNLSSNGHGYYLRKSGLAGFTDNEDKQWTGEWFVVNGYIIVDLVDFERENNLTFIISTIATEVSTMEEFMAGAYSYMGRDITAHKICSWGTVSNSYFDDLLS